MATARALLAEKNGYLPNEVIASRVQKIDQSFIRDCTDNSNLAIIQGIITISQKMGFRTIAEGVETQEQHDFLQNLECNQFQGYLCSKALPAQDIARLIWPE